MLFNCGLDIHFSSWESTQHKLEFKRQRGLGFCSVTALVNVLAF